MNKKPCDVLKEELANKHIIQRELAIRTGVSEKHISTILKGEKSISPSFAKKIEYVLGLSASYWLSLENDYTLAKLDEFDRNNISEEEYDIFESIKDVVSELENVKAIPRGKSVENKIIYSRKFLQVSNLCDLDKLKNIISNNLLYKNKLVDTPYLYSLEKYVNYINKNILNVECDEQKLIMNLYPLKSIMFHESNEILLDINYLLNKIGIYVYCIKDFGRKNVMGIIKKNENSSYSVFVCAKDTFADIFWFKLFHLLSLITFNKVDDIYFDYLNVSRDSLRATSYAQNILINEFNYRDFINEKDFSLRSIETFSQYNDVCNFIVIGRLKEEGYIESSSFPRERIKYHF